MNPFHLGADGHQIEADYPRSMNVRMEMNSKKSVFESVVIMRRTSNPNLIAARSLMLATSRVGELSPVTVTLWDEEL